MPNHVSTKIKFETKEGFDLLLNKEEESVDFNTIIPMPEIRYVFVLFEIGRAHV